MAAADSPAVVLRGSFAPTLSAALERSGWHVSISRDRDDILEAIPAKMICFVLIDTDAADHHAPALITRAATQGQPIAISNDGSPQRIVAAMRAGAIDYIVRDGNGQENGRILARLQELKQEPPPQTARYIASRFNQLMRTIEHDVRNPVSNVLGYVELLLEVPGLKLSQDQAEFLSRIKANCATVLDLVKRFTAAAIEITDPGE